MLIVAIKLIVVIIFASKKITFKKSRIKKVKKMRLRFFFSPLIRNGVQKSFFFSDWNLLLSDRPAFFQISRSKKMCTGRRSRIMTISFFRIMKIFRGKMISRKRKFFLRKICFPNSVFSSFLIIHKFYGKK